MVTEWTQQDSATAREFFFGATGVKLLQELRDHVDSIDGGPSFEAAALAAKEAKGGRDVIKRIVARTDWHESVHAKPEFVDTTL